MSELRDPEWDIQETAADIGDDTDRPWAILARCSGQGLYADGEPREEPTEIRVMAANYRNISKPEAFEGLPQVLIHILHPWGPVEESNQREPLASAHVTAKSARVLAKALLAAADKAEGKT